MKYILSLLLLTISISIAGAAQPAAEIAKRQEMLKIATELKESIKQDPKKVELYIQLGFIYSKLKNINEAQKYFETAVSLNPKKAKPHFMLGLIYEKRGLKNKAIASWQACLDTALTPKMRKKAIKHLHFLRAQ